MTKQVTLLFSVVVRTYHDIEVTLTEDQLSNYTVSHGEIIEVDSIADDNLQYIYEDNGIDSSNIDNISWEVQR